VQHAREALGLIAQCLEGDGFLDEVLPDPIECNPAAFGPTITTFDRSIDSIIEAAGKDLTC